MPDTEPYLDKWLELNREYAEKWPNITRKGSSPTDAEEGNGKKDKMAEFSEKPGSGA